MDFEIIPIPVLKDNYAYLIHVGQTTVVVDPSEPGPVRRELEKRGWGLTAILNTHHHMDHVGGNAMLKQIFQCPVLGPRGDENRIPAFDKALEGGTRVNVGELSIDVIFIPGHTHHHIALWLPDADAVFTGDTLFLMGCGRLFEGSPGEMWASLSLLRELPSRTKVYCGHEYTEANARFALFQSPEDPEVRERMRVIQEKRRRGEPTVPGTLAEERATNPFLRLADEEFRERLFPRTSAVDAFAKLRLRKDDFA